MWIEVLDGDGAGERIEVPATGRIVLGRARGCDLIVRDARASREHVEIVADGDGVRVRDLGSANGTWSGDERITETRLTPGDEVRVAGTRIGLRTAAEPTAPARPTPSVFAALLERSSRRAGRATVLAGAALAAAAVAVVVLLTGGGDRVPEVVAEARASVLRIDVQRDGNRATTGSGWVLDAREGLVVTAAHVVNEGDRFLAQLDDGTPRRATVVAAAPCDDIALLNVDPAGLRTLPLGDQDGLAAGQTVVALGFPAAELTATAGVVAAPRAQVTDPAPDVPALRDAVQTDTAINPGSSGGPLVDLDGRVVGMNAVARTSTAGGRTVQGQNFAIGADRLRTVLDRLRAGRSERWTGLTFGYPTTEELALQGLPPGVFVTGALRGGKADGLTGRLLVGAEGREISPSLSSVCDALDGATGTAALTLLDPADEGAEPEVVRLPLA